VNKILMINGMCTVTQHFVFWQRQQDSHPNSAA
jgi:hypothetical protein